MSRTLIVAQATFDRAAPHVGAIFLGMSATLLLGWAILGLGLPGWLAAVIILAVVVGLALIKARFGPAEIRVDKSEGEDMVRVVGRFAGTVIRDKQARPVSGASITDSGDLRIDLADGDEPDSVWLRQPGFKAESLQLLADLINGLFTSSPKELRTRYQEAYRSLKVYNAKNMLLLRFTERPSYMAMTWLVAGATVLFWMAVLPGLIQG